MSLVRPSMSSLLLDVLVLEGDPKIVYHIPPLDTLWLKWSPSESLAHGEKEIEHAYGVFQREAELLGIKGKLEQKVTKEYKM